MDLNIFCYILQDPQPDTGQGSDSGGEGGEDSVQDKEAEREKYIQKRKYVTCYKESRITVTYNTHVTVAVLLSLPVQMCRKSYCTRCGVGEDICKCELLKLEDKLFMKWASCCQMSYPEHSQVLLLYHIMYYRLMILGMETTIVISTAYNMGKPRYSIFSQELF